MYTWLSNLILVGIFGIWAWMCIMQKNFVPIPNQVLAICIALASGNIGTYIAERIPKKDILPVETKALVVVEPEEK